MGGSPADVDAASVRRRFDARSRMRHVSRGYARSAYSARLVPRARRIHARTHARCRWTSATHRREGTVLSNPHYIDRRGSPFTRATTSMENLLSLHDLKKTGGERWIGMGAEFLGGNIAGEKGGGEGESSSTRSATPTGVRSLTHARTANDDRRLRKQASKRSLTPSRQHPVDAHSTQRCGFGRMRMRPSNGISRTFCRPSLPAAEAASHHHHHFLRSPPRPKLDALVV